MAFLGFGVSRVLKAVAASGVVMGVLAMAAVPPGAFAGSGEPAHKLLKKSSKQASAPVKQNWSSGGNTAGGKATTETAVLSGQATTPFITADSTDKMQAVLSRYEQIVSAGGWPSVPSAKFKKGAKNKGVFALNQRLFVEGYLRKEGTEGEFADTYTSATADAVSRFQRNHGLAVTGIVDKPTLRELNVSASSRLATLRANVPRLAEYSKDLGGRYVVVNVPAMQIETVSNGSVYSRHNAVVGRPSRPTPVVMTPLTVIRFNPYWNAPPSIVEKDILPSMMSGSPAKVMEKMNMKIFKGVGGPEINPNSVNWRRAVVDDYHFRQEPGGTNAMATAKIEFTSPHGIYLHDTPEPQLFSHGQRFYSSGCVRVEKVADPDRLDPAGPGRHRQQPHFRPGRDQGTAGRDDCQCAPDPGRLSDRLADSRRRGRIPAGHLRAGWNRVCHWSAIAGGRDHGRQALCAEADSPLAERRG